MRILSLNAGSNSLKFEIVDVDPQDPNNEASDLGRKIVSGAYDNIGKQDGQFTLFDGKHVRHQEPKDVPSYARAAELLLKWLDQGGAQKQGVKGLAAIEKIGHRVVHGGPVFQSPAKIDQDVIHKIEELQDLAPLHNVAALDVIRAVQKKIGTDLPMVAVFDTLFHQTIPDMAALYPLPLEITRKYKIRRYGFHGISHRYMMLRYAQLTHQPVSHVNLVTLHLEGGSSAAAIRNGQSVDTSMGFTPLEGLMMGTRSGDLDPAIVPYLMRKEKLDEKEIETFLNKKCGLKGVSGVSADTRELRKHMDNPDVALTLRMFCYRVRKYIGAYVAALGGAEAIVFGGGISENSPDVRAQICEGLECLGITIDQQRNNSVVDQEGIISTPDSLLKAWVIPTEEALMVAHEAASVN